MEPAQGGKYKNISGHPITLDDGTVVAAGDFVKADQLKGAIAKSEIESGHLIQSERPSQSQQTRKGNQADG